MPNTVLPDADPTTEDVASQTEAETLAAFRQFLGSQQHFTTKGEPQAAQPVEAPKKRHSLWDHICKAYRHGHGHTAIVKAEPEPAPAPAPVPRKKMSLRERLMNTFTGGVNGMTEDEE